MSQEIEVVENCNAWINSFLGSDDADDLEKLKVGLQPFITEKTVLTEPASLPWRGEHVGYEGWVEFIRRIRPVQKHFASRSNEKKSTYYQEGNVVLREFAIDISGSTVASPFTLKLFERYTVEDGRISQCLSYYYDTASFLEFLALEGLIPKHVN